MTRRAGAISYRRIRAPRDDGGRYLDPPFEQLLSTDFVVNRSTRHGDGDFGGLPLSQIAHAARADLLAAAKDYVADEEGPADPTVASNQPLILTGHQPELYHPGVWFKNLVAARVAREFGGPAVNLLIDNDLARAAAIRVPAGSADQAQLKQMAFDRSLEPVPWEERRVLDSTLFESFGQRTGAAMRPFGWTPVIESIWPSAVKFGRDQRRLGECLAAARRQLERSWGIHNLEVPLGTICQQPAFCRFLVYLLSRLPEFYAIYNDSLARYRRANRVRSRTHPVPALQRAGDWWEAPFWVWSTGSPQRRALFVRRHSEQLEISDRLGFQSHLPLPAGGKLDDAVTEIRAASHRFKLRPRAITTTMFARVFLGDLFVHGLGGAKYDQLTDSIIERFFDFSPPNYAIATATLMLPVPRPTGYCARLLELRRRFREMHYQPDRFVARTPETNRWIMKKTQLISEKPPRGEGQPRQRGIEQANAALRPFLNKQTSELLDEQLRCTASCRNERFWSSREFSFCLFPEETLRQLLLDF